MTQMLNSHRLTTLRRFALVIIITNIPIVSAYAQFSLGMNTGINHTGLFADRDIKGTHYFGANLYGEYSISKHWGVSSTLGWKRSINASKMSIQNGELFLGAYGRVPNLKSHLFNNRSFDLTLATGPSIIFRYAYYDRNTLSMMRTLKLGVMAIPSIAYHFNDNYDICISIPSDITVYDALKSFYAQGIDHSASLTTGLMLGIKKKFGK